MRRRYGLAIHPRVDLALVGHSHMRDKPLNVFPRWYVYKDRKVVTLQRVDPIDLGSTYDLSFWSGGYPITEFMWRIGRELAFKEEVLIIKALLESAEVLKIDGEVSPEHINEAADRIRANGLWPTTVIMSPSTSMKLIADCIVLPPWDLKFRG